MKELLQKEKILLNSENMKKEKYIQATIKTSKTIERNTLKKINTRIKSHILNDDFLLSSFCHSFNKKLNNNKEKEGDCYLNHKQSFKLSRNFDRIDIEKNENNGVNNNYILFQNGTQREKIFLQKLVLHDFFMIKDYEKYKLIKKIKRKKETRKKESSLSSRKNSFENKISKYFSKKNNRFLDKLFIKNQKNGKNKTLKMINNINDISDERENIYSFSMNIQNYSKRTREKSHFNKKLTNLTNKSKFSNKNAINLKEHIKEYKKLMNINIISKPGKDNNKNNVNKDTYFFLPQMNNCEKIKVIGMFSGHGINGGALSREIKEYFQNYFIDLFNNNNSKIGINVENDAFTERMNIKIQSISNYYSIKSGIRKIHLNDDEEKKISIFSDTLRDKSEEIKKVYNKLISNSFSVIYSSHKRLDKILHIKYFNSNIYHLSGSTSLLLFLFNSKNCNKIISSNLGDSKIILISKKYKIKELNTIHTFKDANEKERVIDQNGLIDRFSNEPFQFIPGLSITRSFGDFAYKYLGMNSIPDIKEYDLDEEEIKILIIGNGGFWKFLNNETVMNIVLSYYEHNDIEGAIQKLKETAIKSYKLKNSRFVADITIFVLFFK